jgi:hypothetical protein
MGSGQEVLLTQYDKYIFLCSHPERHLTHHFTCPTPFLVCGPGRASLQTVPRSCYHNTLYGGAGIGFAPASM